VGKIEEVANRICWHAGVDLADDRRTCGPESPNFILLASRAPFRYSAYMYVHTYAVQRTRTAILKKDK
jgi:hypothetical protein